jgi:hypothetical protein
MGGGRRHLGDGGYPEVLEGGEGTMVPPWARPSAWAQYFHSRGKVPVADPPPRATAEWGNLGGKWRQVGGTCLLNLPPGCGVVWSRRHGVGG